MKAIIILLTALAVGFFILKLQNVPPAELPELPATQDHAVTFGRLEATKALVAGDRAFTMQYRSWAPIQAAWALKLLDAVEAGILAGEEQAARGEDVDLDELQRRIDRYNVAAEEFRAAAKSR